jgi:hypothetical protein
MDVRLSQRRDLRCGLLSLALSSRGGEGMFERRED